MQQDGWACRRVRGIREETLQSTSHTSIFTHIPIATKSERFFVFARRHDKAIWSFVTTSVLPLCVLYRHNGDKYSGLPRLPTPLLWCMKIWFSSSTIVSIANAPLLNSEKWCRVPRNDGQKCKMHAILKRDEVVFANQGIRSD